MRTKEEKKAERKISTKITKKIEVGMNVTDLERVENLERTPISTKIKAMIRMMLIKMIGSPIRVLVVSVIDIEVDPLEDQITKGDRIVAIETGLLTQNAMNEAIIDLNDRKNQVFMILSPLLLFISNKYRQIHLKLN